MYNNLAKIIIIKKAATSYRFSHIYSPVLSSLYLLLSSYDYYYDYFYSIK